jgi:hypothetical protein
MARYALIVHSTHTAARLFSVCVLLGTVGGLVSLGETTIWPTVPAPDGREWVEQKVEWELAGETVLFVNRNRHVTVLLAACSISNGNVVTY